ncbi:LamG-like jellyroll fold domain-containing protein [Streptosporangium sp. CA-135522]|uniref:LamG-like jellyroll fold domain-containing protein n=1 Tax=Streptosporangium sp. CA-135522 TaxID=3240072 RepID=UPI003D910F06
MAVRFSAAGQSYTRAVALGTISAFTVACWVKIAANRASFTTPWAIDNGASDYFVLQTSESGVDMAVWDDAGLAQIVRQMTVGTWYYIAIAVNGVDGTTTTRAADDTAFDSGGWTAQSSNLNAATLRIGDSPFGGEWINGAVAAFKFWTVALTQAELEAECRQYMPVRTENLRAWYPLLRPETADYSGRASTLSGGTGATKEDGPPISWGARRMGAWTRAAATVISPVSETGSVRPFNRVKSRTVGQVVETSAAVSSTPNKTRALPPVVETGTAFQVLATKAQAMGQVAGTGSVQPFNRVKIKSVSQVVETGTAVNVRAKPEMHSVVETGDALPFSPVKAHPLGQIAEAGTAESIGFARGGLLAQLVEAGTEFPLLRVKAWPVTPVIGTGTVHLLQPLPPIVGVVGQVLESGAVSRMLRRTGPLRAGSPFVMWHAKPPAVQWYASSPETEWSAGPPTT